MSKTTDLDPISAIEDNDLIQVIDVSDYTMSNDGTNKKATLETLGDSLVTKNLVEGFLDPAPVTGQTGYYYRGDKSWQLLSKGTIGLPKVENLSKADILSNPQFTGTVTGITPSMIGLGEVTNESKTTMFTNPHFFGTVTGITPSMIGLGEVTNESKATMFDNPTFTGTVNTATPDSVSSDETVANTEFVNTKISNEIDKIMPLITNPIYSIIADKTTAYENTKVNFIISVVNPDERILYWDTESTDVSPTSGIVVVNGNTAYFSVDVDVDGVNEGLETFTVNLRTYDADEGPVVAMCTVRILDAGVDYSITPSTTTISEGSSLTLETLAIGMPDGTLYWDTDKPNDISPSSGAINVVNGVGSPVKITAILDGVAEGLAETVNIYLRTDNVAGPIVKETAFLLEDVTNSPTQVGSSILGQYAYNGTTSRNYREMLGTSLAISDDGTILAVTTGYNLWWRLWYSKYYDVFRSVTRVYSLNSGVWTQIGVDIATEGINSFGITSVDLNAAGTKMIIGNSSWTRTQGRVDIYNINKTTGAISLAQTIGLGSSNERIGRIAKMSDDGNRIVINRNTVLEVWDYNGAAFAKSATIALNYSGLRYSYLIAYYSKIDFVDLSRDGKTIAVGLDEGPYRSKTAIYKLVGTSWTKTHQITKNAGYSVTLNATGTRIACFTGKGLIEIYDIAGAQLTKNASITVQGVAYICNVEFNSAGDRLLVGVPTNANNGVNTGKVIIYRYINNRWIIAPGGEIFGTYPLEDNKTYLGASVAINAAGNRIAFGAPGYMQMRVPTNPGYKGSVQVWAIP